MRTKFDEDLIQEEKHEQILLSDLKNLEQLAKESQNNEEDESTEENKEKSKELTEELNKLKEKSIELYYNIDDKRAKEIETVFKQSKLKIDFKEKPGVLKDGVIWSSAKESFIAYDSIFFKKIFEIKFEQECDITSAIELDNKDLVLLAYVKKHDENWNRSCKFLIYRLKENNYNLIQKINEGQKGYSSQFVQYGFCSRSISKKQYEVQYIKKISGNRFICVNNYGFKIYGLNEKQEYCLISLNEYLEGIKIIHEINPNKFIFGTEEHSRNSYIGYYNNIIFDEVELKEITKEEINKRITELDEDDREYFGFFYMSKPNNENKGNEETIKLLESLKVSCNFKRILHYNSGEYSNIIDHIILKNKYMIILMDRTLFVLDLSSGKILKKFEISILINNNLVNRIMMDIQKWNNQEDNNFILFLFRNIYLFELNDDENDIKLKILNHSGFPELANVLNIEKLTENENKFFSRDKKTYSITLY